MQVRALNGETPSDWSDYSDAVRTNSAADAAPVFSETAPTRAVPENSAAGTDVGEPVTAMPADSGDELTYTLEGTDASSFAIVSTSGQIRTTSGVTYDYEEQSSYAVTMKALGRHGERHHRRDDQSHGRGRAAGQTGEADAGGGLGLGDEPDGALDEAGAERGSGHHRLQRGVPRGHEWRLGDLHARRHWRGQDDHRADGAHVVSGAGAGAQRRDAERSGRCPPVIGRIRSRPRRLPVACPRWTSRASRALCA